MKFTALHRQYPPLYIGYVFLYIIPPVGYTDSGIGMIEHAVIRSHETYPAQFSHRIGCVILGFIGFPCLVIGFPCDCFRIRSIGLSAYLSDRGWYPRLSYFRLLRLLNCIRHRKVQYSIGFLFCHLNDRRNMLPNTPFASHIFHIGLVLDIKKREIATTSLSL